MCYHMYRYYRAALSVHQSSKQYLYMHFMSLRYSPTLDLDFCSRNHKAKKPAPETYPKTPASADGSIASPSKALRGARCLLTLTRVGDLVTLKRARVQISDLDCINNAPFTRNGTGTVKLHTKNLYHQFLLIHGCQWHVCIRIHEQSYGPTYLLLSMLSLFLFLHAHLPSPLKLFISALDACMSVKLIVTSWYKTYSISLPPYSPSVPSSLHPLFYFLSYGPGWNCHMDGIWREFHVKIP